ncbi:hypothetical protein, partial [Chryseobacterium sp. CH1]|uniref:hypothetical protein n=1 Tax=Chryseobacterium sp. CH1 TaxID=713551 RepID=UPI0010281530
CFTDNAYGDNSGNIAYNMQICGVSKDTDGDTIPGIDVLIPNILDMSEGATGGVQFIAPQSGNFYIALQIMPMVTIPEILHTTCRFVEFQKIRTEILF